MHSCSILLSTRHRAGRNEYAQIVHRDDLCPPCFRFALLADSTSWRWVVCDHDRRSGTVLWLQTAATCLMHSVPQLHHTPSSATIRRPNIPWKPPTYQIASNSEGAVTHSALRELCSELLISLVGMRFCSSHGKADRDFHAALVQYQTGSHQVPVVSGLSSYRQDGFTPIDLRNLMTLLQGACDFLITHLREQDDDASMVVPFGVPAGTTNGVNCGQVL